MTTYCIGIWVYHCGIGVAEREATLTNGKVSSWRSSYTDRAHAEVAGKMLDASIGAVEPLVNAYIKKATRKSIAILPMDEVTHVDGDYQLKATFYKVRH